jgi:hypothetical protein
MQTAPAHPLCLKTFRGKESFEGEQCSATVTPVFARNFGRQIDGPVFHNDFDRTSDARICCERNSRKEIVLELWTEANNSAHVSCGIKFRRKGAEEKRKILAASQKFSLICSRILQPYHAYKGESSGGVMLLYRCTFEKDQSHRMADKMISISIYTALDAHQET